MLSLVFRGTPDTEAHRQAHTYNLLHFYYATLTLSIYSKIITYLSNRAMLLHAELTSCDKAIAAIREKKKTLCTTTQINAYSQSHANS